MSPTLVVLSYQALQIIRASVCYCVIARKPWAPRQRSSGQIESVWYGFHENIERFCSLTQQKKCPSAWWIYSYAKGHLKFSSSTGEHIGPKREVKIVEPEFLEVWSVNIGVGLQVLAVWNFQENNNWSSVYLWLL